MRKILFDPSIFKGSLEVANNDLWQLKFDVHYTVKKHLGYSVSIFIVVSLNLVEFCASLICIYLELISLLVLLCFIFVELFILSVLELGQFSFGFKLSALYHLSGVLLSLVYDLVSSSFGLQ